MLKGVTDLVPSALAQAFQASFKAEFDAKQNDIRLLLQRFAKVPEYEPIVETVLKDLSEATSQKAKRAVIGLLLARMYRGAFFTGLLNMLLQHQEVAVKHFELKGSCLSTANLDKTLGYIADGYDNESLEIEQLQKALTAGTEYTAAERIHFSCLRDAGWTRPKPEDDDGTYWYLAHFAATLIRVGYHAARAQQVHGPGLGAPELTERQAR